MIKRATLSRAKRVRIFDAADGICYLCDCKIHAERGAKWIVEHVKPLWLGGADNESNMRPVHFQCAIKKTAAEIPVKAKGDRVRARHLGVKKPRSIRGWRKFRGQPVYASRER